VPGFRHRYSCFLLLDDLQVSIVFLPCYTMDTLGWGVYSQVNVKFATSTSLVLPEASPWALVPWESKMVYYPLVSGVL